MTRRERMERRLEQRREWAEGRNAKAAALLKRNEPYRGDIAFNTQPGHIPERARVIAREDKAIEHHEMARHHEAVASTLDARLETTVFSDDPDAVPELERRIKAREAERDRIKRYNASCRAAAKRGELHGDLSILDESQRRFLAGLVHVCAFQVGPGGSLPGYLSSNLGGRIKADRDRIEAIKARQERTAEAEAAPGGAVVKRLDGADYCSVTFAEKPARSVLDALRGAGFWWRGGSWHGPASKLPAEVAKEEQ